MNRKSDNEVKDFSQLIEQMFSPEVLNVESYFATKAGTVVAGTKNKDNVLENARIVDTGFETTVQNLNMLNSELAALRAGKMKLKELTPAEYAEYGITPEQVIGGLPPDKNKKGPTKRGKANTRKVSAGTTNEAGEAEERVKLKDFFSYLTNEMLEQTKKVMIDGGNPMDYFNPDFKIYNKTPNKRAR